LISGKAYSRRRRSGRETIKDFVKTNFPTTPLLDYALEVEKITTSKV